jgi:predicted exporter
MHGKTIQYHWIVVIALVSGLLLAAAISRLDFDTNVAASLPEDGGVLSDAVYIFNNHPIQNEIAIDIACNRQDRDFLVQLADQVESQLRQSGLFLRVGTQDMQQVIPQLIGHVMDQLPFLFSDQELQTQISPLISPQSVQDRFKRIQQGLMRFDAIGQAGLIARDPLGFRELKLANLAELAPSRNVQIYKGQLLSMDGRHVMVIAQPSGSGTDTAFARRLSELTTRIDASIQALHADRAGRITLTPVGAYRAALDNERMARSDVNKAVLLSTLGIAALLLLAFPRPLIGLLALLPALAGTILALFAYSLIYKSMSIMALGFGGAVISITVDHGIAYLLFLDRPQETSGRIASREVWSVGLLAVLTTIGAFLVLSTSGFLIFKQLGIFTAMGITFSFIFVHTAFPRIFPTMPPARSRRSLPLQSWADRLAKLGPKGALTALLLACFLLFWVRPHFSVDLDRMNSVSADTRAAESLFSKVWGNIFGKIYIMSEGQSITALQEQNDKVLAELEKAQSEHEIQSVFSSAGLFPGPARRSANHAAWIRFWSDGKADQLQQILTHVALQYGFNPKAFTPFFKSLTEPPDSTFAPIAPRFQTMMGISRNDKDGSWHQVIGITPGPEYDAEAFYSQFSRLARVFDAHFFSKKMAQLLFSTFSRMLLIIGASVAALLLIFFADWQLTVISLLPILFAFVCTLGSLGLMGRALDIPALMLAIIVLGMGIDYSLFFVRSYQRYQDSAHPNFGLIRMSVFMAAVSTLIGFGVLCGASHALLQSAGISSFLGIGFSMLGAFLILPPILERRLVGQRNKVPDQTDAKAFVSARYQNLEPYPRFFARFKLKLDPMFKELPAILPPSVSTVSTILDIGSGCGVPANWLLHRYPGAKVFGIEPQADRVRVANFALGRNGRVTQGLAPQVPDAPLAADAAFVLDMCHFLDDNAFDLTLARLHERLKPGAFLILRAVLRPHRSMPWTWWLENSKMKLQGAHACYRTQSQIITQVSKNHFKVVLAQSSGRQEELAWVVAIRQP